MTRLPVALALVAVLAAGSDAAPLAGDLAVRRALRAASVVIETTGCSGAVAEDAQIIVTAKHCLRGDTLRVRLSDGSVRTAWLVATNEASDQAVLFLEERAPVEPLPIVRRRQIPGTLLYFEGNPSRPRFQSARLDRIGRCPSLPNLPNALFTSIQGVPGDSGAPLVDSAARIVGLVHGGVRCHIATPADALARLVDHVLERDGVEVARARLSAGRTRLRAAHVPCDRDRRPGGGRGAPSTRPRKSRARPRPSGGRGSLRRRAWTEDRERRGGPPPASAPSARCSLTPRRSSRGGASSRRVPRA